MRPTSDKVRGAIFSILLSRRELEGAAVLDLFAGTGALGIEALSRGAASAVFLEKDSRTAAVTAENVTLTGFESVSKVVRGDAERFDLSTLGRFDVVFVDPPYAIVPRSRAIAGLAGVLAEGGVAVVEHDRDAPPGEPEGLEAVDLREYGSTAVTFFHRRP